jgi:hypothetical protein
MTVSPSPEQLSELDADSGMSGDAVAQAEMVWANLPTLPWTSLATHEKALVCHTLARLTADALESAQSEIARLTTVSGDDEAIAKLFHEAYERLAPQFSYETRKASAVPWDQVPENNRKLMIAVAGEVRAALKGNQP